MGISAIWSYYTVLSRTRSTPNHSPVTLCIVLYSCAINQNVILVTIMVSSDYETFDMKQLPPHFHSTHAKISFSFYFSDTWHSISPHFTLVCWCVELC